MDLATRKMVYYGLLGLLLAGSTIAVFRVAPQMIPVQFLAKDGTVSGNRVSPARSACAVIVSSQNQSREWLYSQQQTTSAGGFAGTAFSTYVPHTVRATETR